MKRLDGYVERYGAASWPWLVLIAVMFVISYAACYAGRAAQRELDEGADNRRGAVTAESAGHALAKTKQYGLSS
jgi:hypothetical protein